MKKPIQILALLMSSSFMTMHCFAMNSETPTFNPPQTVQCDSDGNISWDKSSANGSPYLDFGGYDVCTLGSYKLVSGTTIPPVPHQSQAIQSVKNLQGPMFYSYELINSNGTLNPNYVIKLRTKYYTSDLHYEYEPNNSIQPALITGEGWRVHDDNGNLSYQCTAFRGSHCAFTNVPFTDTVKSPLLTIKINNATARGSDTGIPLSAHMVSSLNAGPLWHSSDFIFAHIPATTGGGNPVTLLSTDASKSPQEFFIRLHVDKAGCAINTTESYQDSIMQFKADSSKIKIYFMQSLTCGHKLYGLTAESNCATASESKPSTCTVDIAPQNNRYISKERQLSSLNNKRLQITIPKYRPN
jgi:hypothetical protein